MPCLAPAQPTPGGAAPPAPISRATLIDVGAERYRAGAYREAVAVFNSIVARHPDDAEAHLYLVLSDLQLGEDALAQRHLVLLRDLAIGPRARVQVERLLEAMRAGPLASSMRAFIIGALEEAMLRDRLPPGGIVSRDRSGRAVPRYNYPYLP